MWAELREGARCRGDLGLRYADPGLCFGVRLGRIGCVNRG